MRSIVSVMRAQGRLKNANSIEQRLMP
jgi:hypothetical protein